MKQVICAAALVAASFFPASIASAQDLSEAEMARILRSQLQAIGAAEADPAMGKTRGIVLVDVAKDGAPDPAAADAGAAPSLSLVAAAGGDAHLALPKDLQLNVRITFAFDSAALAASQKPALREVCGALGDAGVGVLRIVGHTDASGPWSYNQKLSELRAEEVKRFFVSDCGVAPDRLQAVGVGEQFPFDEGAPEAAVNRRVEFQAVS